MRANNFDLVRLFLAILVVFEHAYLVGLDPIRMGAWGLSFDGYTAVQCFFVISGFLIFQSWENTSDTRRYFSKRARRIYPAYFTIVVAMALLGVFLTSLDPVAYFTSSEWIKYLLANLVFLNFIQPTLPGVFAGSVEPIVNGPLWTIKLEVMFYLSVPLIAYIGRRTNMVTLLIVLYVGSTIWAQLCGYLNEATGRGMYATLGRQLPGQLSFFVAGGLIYYHLDAFKKYAHLLVLIALPVAIGHAVVGLPWLFPAALAVIVIYVVEVFPYLGNFGRFGDMSYGLYIFHYPVLHIVAAYGFFASAEMSLAFGFGVALVLAFLSWHLIEKPALYKNSHYRLAETGLRRAVEQTGA